MNDNEFGKYLTQLRAERGLSRRELSELLDVGPGMIGHLENGLRLPSVEVAIRLAKVLEVSLDSLLGKINVAMPG